MELKEILKGLRTEIVASHTMDMSSEINRGYNQGLSKAVSFVDSYIEGKGLFQLIPEENKDDKN